MFNSVLRIGLFALGAAAVLIGLSIYFFGPGSTGNAFTSLMATMGHDGGRMDDLSAVNVDSEMRFYAVFWIGYGIAVLATAFDLVARLHWVPWLSAMFLAGGLGRVVSYVLVGPPHPFLMMLMFVELVLPLVFIGLWIGARQNSGR